MKVNDRGFEAIVRETNRLAGLDIVAGVLPKDADKTYPNGMTVLEVALLMIYGTATIPARDFMTGTATAYEHKTADVMQDYAGRVMDGSLSPHAAADELGLWFRGRINAHIDNGPWEGNAESTIRRKGRDQPLVDSKFLYNTLDHEVRKR